MYRKVTIQRINRISTDKIMKTFDSINKSQLTFGVHKEDNDNHETRDFLAKQPLHSALYNNNELAKPIGNAELLAKHTEGFNSAIFIGGVPSVIRVPQRPILQPMIMQLSENKTIGRVMKTGLKGQLGFKNKVGAKEGLRNVAYHLSPQKVLKFVENRGGKYWSPKAKHNNSYTAAVKLVETLGEGGLGNLYNNKQKTIEFMAKWENANRFKAGDMPLMDSLDLLKSIKAKVGNKKEEEEDEKVEIHS